MINFGLVRYRTTDGARMGVLAADRVADASGALRSLVGDTVEMQGVLEQWDAVLPPLSTLAAQAAAQTVATLPVGEVRLLAPLARPVNLYCAFANYVDHMLEMGGQPADKSVEDPYIFQVPVTAISDPDAPIRIPTGNGEGVDWEGELAAVIGRAAHNLTVEDALSCIAGYSILHDVSIRVNARRGANGGRPDFLSSKGRASFKPFGPCIVPAALVPDPQALRLRTWVADVLKQDSTTAQMIFTVAEQISLVSRLVGVVPGDVFATGTPAGVGMPTGTYLVPGQTVRIEIERVGVLSNPVVAM